MSNEHIIDIIENSPLDSLGESELARVREHVGGCAGCRRAYEAARVSASLLKERAAEEFAPPPFFQTRVMAALREQQAAGEVWSLRRMWRTAGALVSSMAVAVAALAVFTFVVPGTSSTGATTDVASVSDTYPGEEEALLAQDELANEEMSYEQVLTSIYESGEDATR